MGVSTSRQGASDPDRDSSSD